MACSMCPETENVGREHRLTHILLFFRCRKCVISNQFGLSPLFENLCEAQTHNSTAHRTGLMDDIMLPINARSMECRLCQRHMLAQGIQQGFKHLEENHPNACAEEGELGNAKITDLHLRCRLCSFEAQTEQEWNLHFDLSFGVQCSNFLSFWQKQQSSNPSADTRSSSPRRVQVSSTSRKRSPSSPRSASPRRRRISSAPRSSPSRSQHSRSSPSRSQHSRSSARGRRSPSSSSVESAGPDLSVPCHFCCTLVLESRMARHHLDLHASHLFSCRMCDPAVFNVSQKGILRHMRQRHPEVADPLVKMPIDSSYNLCTLCTPPFKVCQGAMPTQMALHMAKWHPKADPQHRVATVQCRVCDQRFTGAAKHAMHPCSVKLEGKMSVPVSELVAAAEESAKHAPGAITGKKKA